MEPDPSARETAPPDTAEIRDLLDRLVDAWNRGDADAYGACFTDDATYVTYVGTVYRGRADLAAAHDALFRGFVKGTRLVYDLVDLHFPTLDTATVVTRGDTYKRRPGRLGKVQTYAVVRELDGAWRIAAFHNTARRAVVEAVCFALLPGSRPKRYG